jgi:membrane protease YdiL (CAAX protease family)
MPPMLRHFADRLRTTPLLLGWLIIGPIIAGLLEGWPGLLTGYINVALLGLWVLLIHWMTRDQPAMLIDIKRPGGELAIGLALFCAIFLVQLLDFNVLRIDPFRSGVQGFFDSLRRQIFGLGLPEWIQSDVFIAASSSIKQLVPTVLVLLALGYRPDSMGLRLSHWRLSLVLIGLTILLGLGSGTLFRAPPHQIVAVYLVGLLVNALPEELLFRGMLLPRLEAFTGNSLRALVLSAWLFNLLHLPIALSRGATPFTALLEVFAIGLPTGLVWGYLYLRTRSILPGVLWHGANVTLGYLMLDLAGA